MGIPMKIWYFFIQVIAKIISMLLIKLFFKLDTAGREHLRRIGGPLLIAPKHKSFIDHFLIAAALPFNFRIFPIRPMAHQEQIDRPLIGLGIKMLGGFVAKTKGKNLDELFEVPEAILKNRGVVLLYPEGKIFRDPGIHPIKSGAAELALRTSAAILPVGISGLDYFYLTDLPSLFFNRRKIKINFGEVFPAKCGLNRKELTKKIENEIRKLYEPGYNEHSQGPSK
ncbi:hypothetical protein A2924_01590 [Candidatus Giovannonibacteria bacterium RIFCSPLOWO2_01_FULL_44_16]|uniref:Phospholipid/glycerol acyltransferase domain-containing protein n=1 Tax=Candidatus Giovannonibacteria bacterium RIFCSPLOWO2_01_FULL_44_16 TaxID=1798348 RepID=A0A1F5X4P9_9BACT|nr:MAG: hypothetical protein A2924_01590 [Candidatus Giovannonibacteria bacterium RIFCSPLOWO2_01_FULL_44_16]